MLFEEEAEKRHRAPSSSETAWNGEMSSHPQPPPTPPEITAARANILYDMLSIQGEMKGNAV